MGKLPKVEISSRNRSVDALEPFEGALGDGEGIGQRTKNGVAVRFCQRFADAAGHHPGGMDALSPEALDDLLTKLPQADAVERQLGILFRDAEDVALCRIGVHAEQQVGRGKMKQAERMRLRDLREPEDAAQLVGRGRDPHRQQRIAGLGRRDQMADRANAANARHQRRHLVKWPAFAQLLEAAELGDVKAGVLNPSVFVQVERDLGMAFDARHRIDDDGAALLHEFSSLASSCEL